MVINKDSHGMIVKPNLQMRCRLAWKYLPQRVGYDGYPRRWEESRIGRPWSCSYPPMMWGVIESLDLIEIYFSLPYSYHMNIVSLSSVRLF
jgi:hypothetical protein